MSYRIQPYVNWLGVSNEFGVGSADGVVLVFSLPELEDAADELHVKLPVTPATTVLVAPKGSHSIVKSRLAGLFARVFVWNLILLGKEHLVRILTDGPTFTQPAIVV